jgi:hypothetical protein
MNSLKSTFHSVGLPEAASIFKNDGLRSQRLVIKGISGKVKFCCINFGWSDELDHWNKFTLVNCIKLTKESCSECRGGVSFRVHYLGLSK